MFLVSLCPSSWAYQLQQQPLVLPLERGGSSAVGRGRAGRGLRTIPTERPPPVGEVSFTIIISENINKEETSLLISPLLWHITHPRVVFTYRRFGTTSRSLLQESSSSRSILSGHLTLEEGIANLSRNVVNWLPILRCVTSKKSWSRSLQSRTAVNRHVC
jgi:hypothetical protein